MVQLPALVHVRYSSEALSLFLSVLVKQLNASAEESGLENTPLDVDQGQKCLVPGLFSSFVMICSVQADL